MPDLLHLTGNLIGEADRWQTIAEDSMLGKVHRGRPDGRRVGSEASNAGPRRRGPAASRRNWGNSTLRRPGNRTRAGRQLADVQRQRLRYIDLRHPLRSFARWSGSSSKPLMAEPATWA